MAAKHSEEFKRDAVRIALTSGLTIRQVASDLGIGLSTLGKWVRSVSEEAKGPAQDAELLRENERLRKENRILREERDFFKGLRCFSRPKSRKVSVYCWVSRTLTRSRLCRLMGVSERGLHAWKHRPPSHRQRRDMVLLAHIRDQHRLSLGSYGRPRMTAELNELGIRVGQRRVGRLMR